MIIKTINCAVGIIDFCNMLYVKWVGVHFKLGNFAKELILHKN